MANIVDYVKYYKDKTFDDIPFNDVDSLIFTQIAYVDFSSILKKDMLPISIENLSREYFPKVTKEQMKSKAKLYRKTYDLFYDISNTSRFKDVIISDYEDILDNEKQFCGLTFRYKKNFVYVAFKGTDSSVIGWKEDFDMSYCYPIPSQKCAINFLENSINFFDRNVYVGGHSKGGNLALVSALESSSFVRHRLKTIYSFDGPGLRAKEYHSLAYSKIQNKLRLIIPKDSVVGLLLYHDYDYEVIDSTAKGLWQHDAFTWQCFGGFFIESTLSKRSYQFSKSIKTFLNSIDDLEQKEFIDAIYNLFQKSEIDSIEHVSLSKILKAISLVNTVTSDKKMMDKIKKLLTILVNLYSI